MSVLVPYALKHGLHLIINFNSARVLVIHHGRHTADETKTEGAEADSLI
jgi:hypothetical protein